MLLPLAFLIGFVADLRAMTAPAAIAWAETLGWIDLSGSWASFMASMWTAGILTALAFGEYVTDQWPGTPSRKVPIQFATRVVVGALGGAAFRARLAASLGRDPPAAFIEDAVAITGAFVVMTSLPLSASARIRA